MKILKKSNVFIGVCEKCGAEVECEWSETTKLYQSCYDGSADDLGQGIKCPTCSDWIVVTPKKLKKEK